MTGWSSALTAGVGELLDEHSVGVWRPGGVYEAGETGIVVGAMPPEPERVILLTVYRVSEDIDQADVRVAVQVRCRAGRDPNAVMDLDDEVFNVLHGLNQTQLGGVRIVQMWRQSSAPMGRDSRDRWEHSSNYYVDAMRPTAHRPF